MTSRIYVRDLDMLLELFSNLDKFHKGAADVLHGAEHEIKIIQDVLQRRGEYWQVELRKREEILLGCMAITDNIIGCGKETAAVREAMGAIEQLRRLAQQMEMVIGEYSPAAKRFINEINGNIGKAKTDLNRSIYKYQSYLAHQSQLSRQSGSSSHGYSYQRARHELILNTVHRHPFLDGTSSAVRGELITNVKRQGENAYIKSPKNFQAGHMFQGFDHWSVLRWEDAYMNDFRGGKWKR